MPETNITKHSGLVPLNNRGANLVGFTLIELLVVISIIGFLASMSVFAFNTARLRARDARRQADLAHLQKAVEMYVGEYGKPPETFSYGEGNTGGWDSSYEGDFMQFLKGTAGSSNPRNIQFIAAVPKDPLNTGSGYCSAFSGYHYCYYYYASPAWGIGPHYRIGAKLERTGTVYWFVNPM